MTCEDAKRMVKAFKHAPFTSRGGWLWVSVAACCLFNARIASAESCGDVTRLPCCPYDASDTPEVQARDFSPWLFTDADGAAAWLDAVCTFAPSEGLVDVIAEVSSHPPETAPPTSLSQGCGEVERFGRAMVRFTPTEMLDADVTYEVVCDGERVGLEFRTGQEIRTADPPTLMVRAVGVGAQSCDGVDQLTVEIAAIPLGFFARGGVVVAEYGDDRIDYVHMSSLGIEEVVDRLVFALPLERDESIMIYAVTGAGLEGQRVEVDVRGVGVDREIGGCSARSGEGGARGAWLAVLCVLMFVQRKRRSKNC